MYLSLHKMLRNMLRNHALSFAFLHHKIDVVFIRRDDDGVMQKISRAEDTKEQSTDGTIMTPQVTGVCVQHKSIQNIKQPSTRGIV